MADSDAPNSAAEGAVARFAEGLNCSQAVFAAFAQRLGLGEDTARKVASGFGGGMGRMGHTCGAVSGAFMALGLRYGPATADGPAKDALYAKIRQFAERFAARHGALDCRDLLGFDLSNPEDAKRARELDLFKTRCPAFVRDAAAIVDEML